MTMEGCLSNPSEEIFKRPLQRKVTLWQDNKCDTLGEKPCSPGDDPHHPPIQHPGCWRCLVWRMLLGLPPRCSQCAPALRGVGCANLGQLQGLQVVAAASSGSHHQSTSHGTSQGLRNPLLHQISNRSPFSYVE